jgi:diguanylate cyclase (GGDEF)-like protein
MQSLSFKSPDRSSAPASSEEALASAQAKPTSAEAPQRGAVSLHRRYYALLRRSRLAVVAFWVATAYFLYWAIPWFRVVPWLPGGLTKEDYTEQVTLTLLLGGLCVILGVGALVLREHLRRTREALLAWTAVYDETTGLYNRRYFFDRLSLECERARRQGATFSLILMRFEHSTGHGRGPSGGVLRRLGAVLTRTVRSNDLVALLGANELAVVAMGVPRKLSPQMVDRLKDALEGSLVDAGDRLNLRLGVATYGTRCRDPGMLMRSARRSLGGQPSSEEAEDKEEPAA